jgi:hypothetical protein
MSLATWETVNMAQPIKWLEKSYKEEDHYMEEKK